MGEEIPHTRFTAEEEREFQRRLKSETAQLAHWFSEHCFSQHAPMAGFELEAWLVDDAAAPVAENEQFLQRLNNPLVVPELSRFNVELNGHPQMLHGDCFSVMERELNETWRQCRSTAEQMKLRLIMIGILPTLEEGQLTLKNMSAVKRYRALNEQVLNLREGKALELDIHGREVLKTSHGSVMLESATTSFQIHLKVDPHKALRCYNASILLSAPMVACSANSPYLFGHDLWNESRIPLFEQSVAVGGLAGAAHGPLRRVSFGSGYARHSLMECFTENAEHFPVLLPTLFAADDASLPHLRLHNGTIWRWNRPLLGFDEDGTPHLRIEHRVVPGGPTVVDEVANMAFYYGLVSALAAMPQTPEECLSFADARDNFYAAARDGLEASLKWLSGHKYSASRLLLEQLIPLAQAGLAELQVDPPEADYYLDIVRQRVANAGTGANWQRAFVARYGADFRALTEAYWEGQESGVPVHRWRL